MNTREALHSFDYRNEQLAAAAKASMILNSAIDYCNTHKTSDGKAVMEFLLQDDNFRRYVDDNKDTIKRAMSSSKTSNEVIGEWIGFDAAIASFMRKYPPNYRSHQELLKITSSSIDSAKLHNSLADHRCVSAEQEMKTIVWLENEILPVLKKLHDYRSITGADWGLVRKLCDDAGFSYRVETFEDHSSGVRIKKFTVTSIAALSMLLIFAGSITLWSATLVGFSALTVGVVLKTAGAIGLTELASGALGWLIGKFYAHGLKKIDDSATAEANQTVADLGYNAQNIPVLCKRSVTVYSQLYNEFTRIVPYFGVDESTTTTTTQNSDGSSSTSTSTTSNDGVSMFVTDVYDIAYAILSLNLGAIRNMIEILAVVQR